MFCAASSPSHLRRCIKCHHSRPITDFQKPTHPSLYRCCTSCRSARTTLYQTRKAVTRQCSSRPALQPIDPNLNTLIRSPHKTEYAAPGDIRTLRAEYAGESAIPISQDPHSPRSRTSSSGIEVQITSDSSLRRRIEATTPFSIYVDEPTSSPDIILATSSGIEVQVASDRSFRRQLEADPVFSIYNEEPASSYSNVQHPSPEVEVRIPSHSSLRRRIEASTAFSVYVREPASSYAAVRLSSSDPLTHPRPIRRRRRSSVNEHHYRINRTKRRVITTDSTINRDRRTRSLDSLSISSTDPLATSNCFRHRRDLSIDERRTRALFQRRSQTNNVVHQPIQRHTTTDNYHQRARLSYMLTQTRTFPERHHLGPMNVECTSCHALHFANTKRTPQKTSFYLCCGNGRIIPRSIATPPDYLLHLLTDDSAECREFQARIVQYNSALAFTSCQFQQSEHVRDGFQSFVIRGELYHLSGPVRAPNGAIPRLAQIYIYDPDAATDYRVALMPNDLNPTILRRLDEMLRPINPFIQYYRTAAEIIVQQQTPDLRILLNPQLRLIMEHGSDRRRTNLPTANEIAVVIPNEYEQGSFRDIVLYARQSGNEQQTLRRIHSSHPAYMPLAYPILFPYGEAGWHWNKPLNVHERIGPNNRITQRMWYRHLAFDRPHSFNIFRYARRLAQRYWVDAYAVIDQERIEYARTHQKTFRADLYRGIQDRLALDDGRTSSPTTQTGQRIILPSSYVGSDRFMATIYQDSMALLRRYGKPSLFITMTANPKWDEITTNLPVRGDAISNPGLSATVFHRKHQALMEDLKREFGKFLATCWTIEYQKRGLPHAHILIFLTREDTFLDCTRIDDFIRAEIPESEIDPDGELRQIVEQHMIHGPCGALNPKSPCMTKTRSGIHKCSKGFPKTYCNETTITESGYPQYRRRNNTYVTKRINGIDVRLGNEWVVPYSPYLSRKYRCHINIEVCESIQAIRYIHKYIYKGEDRTTIEIRNNEIQQYLEGRYIGPIQAAYQILEYPTHREFPPVEHLTVHLPGAQAVYFPEYASTEQLQRITDYSRTTLLAFLEYNRSYTDGRHLLYHEFPEHFVYIKSSKPYHWKRRQKGTAIGRLIHLSPCAGDIFYLRLLLTKIPGPTCFEDLRTIDGHLYTTFKEACIASGFLEDDGEWSSCFAEAAEFAIGGLRHLFVIALTIGDVVRPHMLWEQFKYDICEGLDYHIRQNFEIESSREDLHLDYGLFLIQKALAQHSKTLNDFELPVPTREWERYVVNPVISAASDFDPRAEELQLETNLPKLNEGQRRAYDAITTAIERTPSEAYFFLQGPGGTGKTFLYSVLCNTYRARGDIVLCVASSGIAALLLPGGQTAHSRFGIPLQCTSESTCKVTKQSDRAELLRRVRLIIWDEAPMQHKYNVVAVHNTLCDIRESDELFGGVPIVFGGDFAQILPVVPRAIRAGTVDACLRRAFFWPRLKILRLTENMRLPSDPVNHRWATWIQDLSYNPLLYGSITLPDIIKWHFTDSKDFYTHVFPIDELRNPLRTSAFFTDRAILAPHNEIVRTMNEDILEYLPGDTYHLHAIDSVATNEDTTVHELSTEFLASLNPTSLPPAHLRLKLGAPVMLLRNLYPREGLCNGTRGIVQAITRTCIQFKVTGGRFDGAVYPLPRIKLTSNEDELPWIITRKQFPIRLCFAMTINKAQGQSIRCVGVDLRVQCFSHGQLYVAFSRVTDVERLCILWHKENSKRITENVVFPEVLEGSNDAVE